MIVATLIDYTTKKELKWGGYFKACPRVGEAIEEDGIMYVVIQVCHSNAHGLLIYLQTLEDYEKERKNTKRWS